MADLLFDTVFRQGKAACLKRLLKRGFTVFLLILEIGTFDTFREKMAYHLFRRVEIRIEADGGKHRLHRVRQYRRPSEAAAFQLARSQIQTFSDIHFRRNLRQHTLIDQACPQPRQLALRQLRKRIKQHPRHRIIQNRITDKLEPFIVFRIAAPVRQSLPQKRNIAELIAQLFLYRSMCLLFQNIVLHYRLPQKTA